MEPPRLELNLDQADEALFPGETLSGSYAITGSAVEEVRAVELSVLWQTAGKGDENLGVHFFWRRESKSDDEILGTGTFSTVLPPSPLSYHGVLFRIFWVVRLRVFLRGKDFSEEREFQLGNLPPAVRLEPVGKGTKPMTAKFLESGERE